MGGADLDMIVPLGIVRRGVVRRSDARRVDGAVIVLCGLGGHYDRAWRFVVVNS
jgi:hypothetical protein